MNAHSGQKQLWNFDESLHAGISIIREIFNGGMLFRNSAKTLLKRFRKIIFNHKVIVKSI